MERALLMTGKIKAVIAWSAQSGIPPPSACASTMKSKKTTVRPGPAAWTQQCLRATCGTKRTYVTENLPIPHPKHNCCNRALEHNVQANFSNFWRSSLPIIPTSRTTDNGGRRLLTSGPDVRDSQARSKGAFSHSARTAPIIMVIIRVTAPKTTHLRNHAQPIQISKIQTSDACHGSQGPKFCPL